MNILFNFLIQGKCYVVGGFIRDLYFKKMPRDIDILVEEISPEFKKYLIENGEINKFGGHHLCINGLNFDIWDFKSNWAFKNNILEPKVENITLGCFLNINSAVYDFQRNVFYVKYFMEAVESKTVDFLIDTDYYVKCHPQPEYVSTKIKKILKDYDLKPSDRLKIFLEKYNGC